MIQKIRNLDPVYYVLYCIFIVFTIFKIRVFCICQPCERYISQSKRVNCDLARRYVGLNLTIYKKRLCAKKRVGHALVYAVGWSLAS